MTPIQKNIRFPFLLSALLGLSSLSAQVEFGGSYFQDFDTLPTNTNVTDPIVFTNNDTLLGWYTNREGSGRASSGQQSNYGKGIYDWGQTDSTDRALGTFNKDGFSPETAYFGVQLLNTSGSAIESITLTYTVEQWRRNVEATTWTGSYLVTADSGDMIGSEVSGYTGIAAATVTAQSTGSAGSMNGNMEANQQGFTITLTNLNWQAGEYLWIRWGNAQVADSSGMGIDNLTITAIPEAETSSLLLAATLALAVAHVRRRHLRAMIQRV
ncbi:MAG: endonuclease [Verrucomicrobiota bacterium JB024]|nr:endonuclease [Verrucomicrobiota bacterium JB024]